MINKPDNDNEVVRYNHDDDPEVVARKIRETFKIDISIEQIKYEMAIAKQIAQQLNKSHNPRP